MKRTKLLKARDEMLNRFYDEEIQGTYLPDSYVSIRVVRNAKSKYIVRESVYKENRMNQKVFNISRDAVAHYNHLCKLPIYKKAANLM